MSDNISRQAAMAYPLSWEHYDVEHGDRKFICGVESYREYIEHLPSVDEWIPCSERLPRYGEYVLTFRPTMAMEMVVDSYVGFYGEDDDEWYEGWSIASFCSNDDIVTAWMPLPEPYKGGAE